MNIFISHRTSDTQEVNELIEQINDVTWVRHIVNSDPERIWHNEVKTKIKESNLVIFLIGSSFRDSENVKWEFNESIKQKKNILAIKLKYYVPAKYIKNHKGLKLIPKDIVSIKKEISNYYFKINNEILLEQYKIMVSSTEKVTEQRLKVNNLFVTIITSVLTLSAVVGKIVGFEDSESAKLTLYIMLFFTIVSFVLTFSWSKLINSYGDLNTGKFKVIDDIEFNLNTNMFRREWEILQNEVGYQSNTQTECRVIKRFQFFIIIYAAILLYYYFTKLN